MEINSTDERLRDDPLAAELVNLLRVNEKEFGIENSSVYVNFPIYRESDNVVAARLILCSPNHGVFVFAVSDASRQGYEGRLAQADSELDTVFGQINARLSREKSLRRDKKNLSFNTEPAIFAPNLEDDSVDDCVETDIITNRETLLRFLNEHRLPTLNPSMTAEIKAVIEGAKGLLPPRQRVLDGLSSDSKAVQVSRLESEIRSFDRDQKHGYMEVFEGPQRIRGLAGSGKTVVLAMKAALTHLQFPEATILYTFYTRSLYQHVQRLITRFYRQYNDQDPDWNRLQIKHAWGGRSRAGVYYDACISHGVIPLPYREVSSSPNPFDTVCCDLLSKATIRPTYDFVFVDEGQDFPASFLQLALYLAIERRFVYAYDELQNIFQATVPSAESVFGQGFQLSEDVVLHKCYRNPREILVTAHCLGFGIYSSQVAQMLDRKEHWTDLGYEIVEGELSEGEEVEILRPAQNSPNSISDANDIGKIINCRVLSNANEEIRYVADNIVSDIRQGGLNPEDLMVICADDRYARNYFNILADMLREEGIAAFNLNSDISAGDVFTREKTVTLSSIHRAKGNEGYSVHLMGVDALFVRPTVRGRNLLFTAMTRAKAWLSISGTGSAAQKFKTELDAAMTNFPLIRFKYPGTQELSIMKRDLVETPDQKLERALDEVIDELPEDEIQKVIARLTAARRKKFQ